MSPRRWTALVLEIPATEADETAATLGAESIGSEIVPTSPGRVRLRVYFDSGVAAERAAARAGGAADPWLESVEDGRWVERYQASLSPFPLGTRFEVQPASPRPVAPGRIALRLVPGRAFGTGEHTTTRLVAAALETRVQPGSRWIDLGCGSGILAMVAAHCGAAPVLALDLDAEAVELAREAVRANGLGASIGLAVGSIEAARPTAWDGVAANVETPFFLGRAAAVERALRPGGLLLASGIPEGEAEAVERALAGAGLAPLGRAAEAGWALVVARRPGRAAT